MEKERVCINCGKCVESCPVRIHVKDVDDAFEARDYSLAKKLGAETCLNCGVCTYVCPAKRDLAQKVNFMKNFATGRSNKNSEDSDYVLLEGEDADTTYSFDKILDVVNMAKTNKKTEKPLPVAKDHTSNLNEIRIDKIKPEGGNKNE